MLDKKEPEPPKPIIPSMDKAFNLDDLWEQRERREAELMRHVVWFSCGAASAVAAKVATEKWPDTVVVYCDTMASEHPDNERFFSDVQAWIGRPIRRIKSTRYDSVDDVFLKTRYMSGVAGARCTVEMKKLPREEFQRETDVHVFGYTTDELARAAEFEQNNPTVHVEWVLIDEHISKVECLKRLGRAGIQLPEMYRLGFDHNNCLGCVKASSPDYWNKIRKLFPEVFARRAEQSRLLGVKLVRVDGERIYLDELQPNRWEQEEFAIDCGPVCQMRRAV